MEQYAKYACAIDSNFDILKNLKNFALYIPNSNFCLDTLVMNQNDCILSLFSCSEFFVQVVWKEYGSYLMEKRYYDEAGIVFTRCEDYEKALKAYKESLNWQSMLCAAMQLSYSDDRIISLCLETVG